VVAFESVARSLASWGELARGLRPGRAGLRELRTRLAVRRITRRLLAESGGGVLEQFGTKTDEFVRAMALGRCRRAGPIERFDGDRVVFAGGDSCTADMVVFCTGFEPGPGFIEPEPSLERHLHIFDPAIGPSLGVVGRVRPAHGSIPPLAELQARYFALVTSGKRDLPCAAEMRESIAGLAATRARLLRAAPHRLPHLVDYTSFCDELAERIGCKPTAAAVRAESRAFRARFYAGPFVAAQYRLVGPHAKPDLAREAIEGLSIRHPRPMLVAFYLRWAASRALGRLLGPEFAPKLTLARD
jgi:dimethylaniline monooxygenase (N-oxide forming)